uniref:L-xylulose reductase-like n=1 Tax=Hirondellea gigas TaxID=1518452 RepID=A0A2P2HYK2_9CRUS
MNFDFSGKRALVTGAGAGIGRATALKLAELGAQVIALSRTKAHLDSLKQENPSIEIICVDLVEWSTTREAIKKVTPIHLLVNNAGICLQTPLLDATPEQFDLIFNVNLKAIMNVSQIVVADLLERNLKGNIVNVSSLASHRGVANFFLYAASKSAVDSFTKTMALELSPKGIRVNAVNPTVVMTEMGRHVWSDKEKSEAVLARIPQGKFVEKLDVVNGIVFLLSDNSDMINGHMLLIEGGLRCC